MQGTSLMLYLKVTDFSLMSPSSHEVSIELSMKACRLEAENPTKFCDLTLTKRAVICNTCLLLEKLHQVPCHSRGCVCVCARGKEKSFTLQSMPSKRIKHTLPRDSTGLRISPTTSMFFNDNIKAFLASSRLLPWAKMWPNWESAYSWMPPLAPMLK